MSSENYISILISVLALILSVVGLIFSIRYSRISVLNMIQELGIRKARECNILWKEALHAPTHPQLNDSHIRNFNFTPVVNEVVISIKLLDNSVSRFIQSGSRKYFFKQFWIQLDYGLRIFLSGGNNFTQWDTQTLHELRFMEQTFKEFFQSESI